MYVEAVDDIWFKGKEVPAVGGLSEDPSYRLPAGASSFVDSHAIRGLFRDFLCRLGLNFGLGRPSQSTT